MTMKSTSSISAVGSYSADPARAAARFDERIEHSAIRIGSQRRMANDRQSSTVGGTWF